MSGVTFLDPGLLDRRAVLEETAGETDAMGGRSLGWLEVAELSAHLEAVSADARERFDRRDTRLTHRVTIRHREGVRHGMALRFGQRRLLIREVRDPDERRRYLVCRCEEEA